MRLVAVPAEVLNSQELMTPDCRNLSRLQPEQIQVVEIRPASLCVLFPKAN
jgi:hypothetical protein